MPSVIEQLFAIKLLMLDYCRNKQTENTILKYGLDVPTTEQCKKIINDYKEIYIPTYEKYDK